MMPMAPRNKSTSSDDRRSETRVPPCVASHVEELADRRVIGLMVVVLVFATIVLAATMLALALRSPMPVYVAGG